MHEFFCLHVFSYTGLPRWLSGLKKKKSVCQAGDMCLVPGLGRFPEKEMATHSSIRAWEIPCIEKPGGAQSIGLQRVGYDLANEQQQ